MIITKENYKNVIDKQNVKDAAKYQPVGGKTFCNIFAQTVASDYGTLLPAGTCAIMLKLLMGNKTPHWNSVDFLLAQNRANQGYTTIGITSDHIVLIYPHGHTPTTIADLYMSMAGYKCFNDTKITYAWTKQAIPSVRFYSWYEK